MKKFSKILSVALLVALVLSLGVANAFAADDDPTYTITIKRDDSWDSSAEAKNATYTWYKIFDADITTLADVSETTGELTGTNGNVVYTVSSEALANAVNAAANSEGTTLFDAKLASDGKYYVTLKNESTGAADIVYALKAMVAANSTLFPGHDVTSDANPVVIDGLHPAYYLILASNGKDAVVQTLGDVTIKEKNDYPTIDKKQKKEADPSYSEAVLPAEIGTDIYYQVVVKIPADATKQINVIDKMTEGLEYDSSSFAISPEIDYAALESTDHGYDSTITTEAKNGWQIKFLDSVVQANRGATITITFKAKVTAAAIRDTGKENEVTLDYDNGNYILKDDVDYEIYFGGIYKVDPNDATANMAGVKFTLADDAGTAVNVTYDSTNGYYVVNPESTSNEVETRAETKTEDGKEVTYYTIKIRGLEKDKVYQLTETETKDGYNLLNGTVPLTKTKDEGDAFANAVIKDTFDKVENNKGTQLPSTGGIGTTIFYVVGGVLVLAAIILLVTKKRMSD